MIVHGAYQVYQFFVHTRFIPALGPLEHVLATPVLHRVHHGRDAEYLDMNYGGFFIIWDKLFGTFAPYTHEPDYGVTAGIRSWSPFWANLHPYAELLAARAAPPIGEPPSRSGSARRSGSRRGRRATRPRPATGSRCRGRRRYTRSASSASRWRRRWRCSGRAS